jgi:hypothetical protein
MERRERGEKKQDQFSCRMFVTIGRIKLDWRKKRRWEKGFSPYLNGSKSTRAQSTNGDGTHVHIVGG